MLDLEPRNVQLQGNVSSKTAAIREVGNLLVNKPYPTAMRLKFAI